MTSIVKIKLGNTPKSFKKTVDIVLLDGSTAPIEFTFKYRTRSEFAKMVDDYTNKLKAEGEKEDAAKVLESQVERYALTDQYSAAHVMDLVEGWDLDQPLTKEALVQLEDEYPGSLSAIMVTYRKSVAEHRVKN